MIWFTAEDVDDGQHCKVCGRWTYRNDGVCFDCTWPNHSPNLCSDCGTPKRQGHCPSCEDI
jgi:hypothetical protein